MLTAPDDYFLQLDSLLRADIALMIVFHIRGAFALLIFVFALLLVVLLVCLLLVLFHCFHYYHLARSYMYSLSRSSGNIPRRMFLLFLQIRQQFFYYLYCLRSDNVVE